VRDRDRERDGERDKGTYYKRESTEKVEVETVLTGKKLCVGMISEVEEMHLLVFVPPFQFHIIIIHIN